MILAIKKVTIRKRAINAGLIQEFRDILSEVEWGSLHSISNPKDAYEYFLKVFSGIYDLTPILPPSLENYQNDIKKSWDVIQEVIGKAKSTKGSFPKRMIVDGQEIFDQEKIANI